MPVVFPALLFLAASLFPCVATADGISGYVDFGYNNLASKSTSTVGDVSRYNSNAFSQRYNLSLSNTLYPYLRLSASGLFDQTDSSSTTNGTQMESTTTRIQPSVDLTLRSPLYTAGARYSRREDTSRSSGSPATTNINEFYGGILGWKPEDFPSVEMRVERSHTFDKERISQDTVSDLAGLAIEYHPTENLALQYRPTYIDTTDRLTGLETQNLSQTARVDYSRSFLQNRVSFGTSYNINYNELITSISGTGSVDISLVPFSGLSSIDDTPVDGALASNAALIDNNLTASAGINIGLTPIGGDARERNIGLDFSIEKEVNTLRVWVDKDLSAAIAGSFAWNVYTSRDNLTWSLLTTLSPAPFGPFDKRFEITFSTVKTRYIKVVVLPLSLTVPGASGFPDIFVTEFQAISRQSADQVRGKSTSMSETYNFDGRALLQESANLYYRLSYYLTRTEPSSEQRWTLSNGLTTSHRFSRIFSGSASAGRDDFSDSTGTGYAYLASTSIEAVPLKTLRHSFGYTGRFEETNIERSTTNSLFLYNYAEVYKGVNLTASGGLSFKDESTGKRSKNTDLSASASIQPHKTLALNYLIQSTRSESSGGDNSATSARTTTSTAGTSYYPFETLYLVAGLSTISDAQGTRRLQNYALNWSPFLGGALQFSFQYNESIGSEKNTRNRTYGPSLTWKVTRTTFLTAAYQILQSTSDDGKEDEKTFSTDLTSHF